MAPTTHRAIAKFRRGGFATTSSTASSSSSLLLLVAAYGLAAVLVILQGAPTASAEKMDTTNTMNDPSDMIEDFAREMMEEGVIDMYDQETGEMVPNSKAAIVNGNPDDPDELDVALFVDHTDEEYEPGSNQTVQVCDFEYFEECEKVTPYRGAPDYYACGESDETNPKTGFKCTNITAVADEDGDLSLIDEIKSPMSMCSNYGDEDEDEDVDAEEVKNNSESRRRLMSSARKGRRAGARSRSLRTAGLRGFGGSVQSGRTSGRGGGRSSGRR